MHPLALVAAVAVIFAALSFGGTSKTSVTASPRRCERKKYKGVVDFTVQEDCSVLESPTALLEAAKKKLGRTLTLDAFTLATIIASEVGSAPDAAKVAVAWVARNASKRMGKSIFAYAAPGGRYGSQGMGGRSQVSTRLPPQLFDIITAEKVLSGAVKDPTGGAIQFDSPRTQRAQYARGEVSKTPEMVAASRQSEGKVMVAIPGVSSDYIRFWRVA